MNDVLNMQLIEQLMQVDELPNKTSESFYQLVDQVFASQLQSYGGLVCYQHNDTVFVELTKTHSIDDIETILKADEHEAIFSAINDNQYHIQNQVIYLPLTYKDGSTIILSLIITDEDERKSINWNVLHKLIWHESRRIQDEALASDTELSEEIQIQRALNELASFASTNQDEKLLLDKGAETLLKILKLDHIGIMLIDEDLQIANLVSNVPYQETSIQQIPVAGEIWDTLAKGEHHITKTITGDNQSEKSLKAIGVQSSIFLPFIDLSGKLMGSIGIDKFDGEIKLSEDQLQTANIVISQLVTQLQNLRLLKNSQRFAEQMQQIAKFGETVQSRFDLEEILQASLHFTHRILKTDYMTISLYDEKQQKLVVRAYRQNGQDTILPSDNPEMPIEKTVTGTVWRNRESIYINNYEPEKFNNPYAKNVNVLFAIALISKGVTRGVIEVGRTQKKGISQIDRSVLSQLANQLAISLENTITYSQSQRLAQNKALANEISLQLQQQMDMDSLLNTTITELGKALGAKRARIRLGVKQTPDGNEE